MMSIDRAKMENRRKVRVRTKLRVVSDLPRLSVHRSLNSIYAQIIDDKSSETLAQANDREIAEKDRGKMSKADRAAKVGEMLAERAKKGKVSKVVFDKGPYRFHGRVKALADAAREGGLEF